LFFINEHFKYSEIEENINPNVFISKQDLLLLVSKTKPFLEVIKENQQTFGENLLKLSFYGLEGETGFQSLYFELIPNPNPITIISEEDNMLKNIFNDLVLQWKRDTINTSSITEMANQISYQQIIGMGKEVIPLILKELSKEIDHWFWALRAITRENPVKDRNIGNLEAMAQDWLEWGTQKGYIA
jgi:hypothetical protein